MLEGLTEQTGLQTLRRGLGRMVTSLVYLSWVLAHLLRLLHSFPVLRTCALTLLETQAYAIE